MSTEPQSIIHALLRVSSKLCSPQKTGNRRRRPIPSLEKIADDESVVTLSSSENVSSLWDPSFESGAFHPPVYVLGQENYRTIDQNEFIEELLTNTGDALCFVLFYRTESYFSDNLDKHLKALSQSKPERRFFRISKNHCPEITSKLNITSKSPTVVAMRRGKVVNKISEFSSVDCSELRQWVCTVELLSF
jgi:hypothetical protein